MMSHATIKSNLPSPKRDNPARYRVPKNAIFMTEFQAIINSSQAYVEYQSTVGGKNLWETQPFNEIAGKIQQLHQFPNERTFFEYLTWEQKIGADLRQIEDFEAQRLWREMWVSIRVFLVANYQETLIEYRSLIDALDESDREVQSAGELLLSEIKLFKRRHPNEMHTVCEMLRYSRELVEDPTKIASYERFAEELEGRSSLAYQVMGHAMKAFGVVAMAAGMLTMSVGFLLSLPFGPVTAGLTCCLGLVMLPIGLAAIEHGKNYVGEGRRKGLSEKAGLFATAVFKDSEQVEDHEDSVALLSLKREGHKVRQQ